MMTTTDAVDAVVDYRAESRAGAHVLDVAARSGADGVLHVELTVSDRIGEIVGEGDLRLPPDTLPPAERLLGQVLRGLSTLHSLPPLPPTPGRTGRPGGDSPGGSGAGGGGGGGGEGGGRGGGGPRRNASRSWSAEEQARLRAEWDAGDSVGTIAAAHGRTRNAIQSRLLKLGLISVDHPESPVQHDGPRP
jgi:hypothetical protein